MLEDFNLQFASGFFIVFIVLLYAWKSGFLKKQLKFAEQIPLDAGFTLFAKLMILNSKPFITGFFKWLFGYLLRIAWYMLILNTIYTSTNDFELTVLFAFAYTLARVTMIKVNKEKQSNVIVLSPAEAERIKNGDATLKDFEADK